MIDLHVKVLGLAIASGILPRNVSKAGCQIERRMPMAILPAYYRKTASEVVELKARKYRQRALAAQRRFG